MTLFGIHAKSEEDRTSNERTLRPFLSFSVRCTLHLGAGPLGWFLLVVQLDVVRAAHPGALQLRWLLRWLLVTLITLVLLTVAVPVAVPVPLLLLLLLPGSVGPVLSVIGEVIIVVIAHIVIVRVRVLRGVICLLFVGWYLLALILAMALPLTLILLRVVL